MKLQEGQRIKLSQGTAPTYRSGDILVTLHGQTGTVIEVGDRLALVEINDGPMVVMDVYDDPRVSLADPETCDRCGAVAKARYSMTYLDTGKVIELLMCQHHANEHDDELMNEGWVLKESWAHE